MRWVVCRFCGERHQFSGRSDGRLKQFQQDPVDRFEGLSLHESYCANKTMQCALCSEFVMCRYLISHYVEKHHMTRGCVEWR